MPMFNDAAVAHRHILANSFATGFGQIFGALITFVFWWVTFAITVLILAQEAPHLLRIFSAAKSMY